jgi:hypothetical protein
MVGEHLLTYAASFHQIIKFPPRFPPPPSASGDAVYQWVKIKSLEYQLFEVLFRAVLAGWHSRCCRSAHNNKHGEAL